MKTISLNGNSLSIRNIIEVVFDQTKVVLSPKAKKRIQACRELVESWIQRDEVIYGVTTGVGEFSNINISHDDLLQLQENLITSHAAGTGEPLPPEVVRAMILLRINALAKGFSGIRLETLDFLLKFLNEGVVPVIPSQGSVGSSGDLVPLAHLVLAMMGKGKVVYQDVLMDANLALKKIHLKPIRLKAKEGLALINGTQMMTAYAAIAVHQAKQLSIIADIAGALSVEGLKGTDTAFDERLHQLRPYPGQIASAKNLRRLMRASEIRESHRYNDPRVQDSYSIRCIPQIHGAARDAIEYVERIVSIEINSATDNPLIFPEDKVHLEGGNFHGEPIALAMDFLGIALSELANISERRIDRLMNSGLPEVPKFLAVKGGLNSGLMMLQYVAASIVSENKVLAHPASVDSIPTSAGKEDLNSMGSISAQKTYQILKNAQTVLAIELICAGQAVDFHRPLKCGKGTGAVYRLIRKHISHVDRDRVLYEDIQTSLKLLRDESVRSAAEKVIGKLD